MVKNWADHCSSDEEDAGSLDAEDASLDGNKQAPGGEQPQALQPGHEGGGDVPPEMQQDQQQIHHSEEQPHEAPMPSGPRQYEMPTEPPYTLFVGNLAFKVLDGGQLAHELTDLAHHVLNINIKVMEVRIIMDYNAPPDRPKHRGFAYVQLETLEMLESMLQFNEIPEVQLFGRKIQFDTSTTQHGDRGRGRRGSQNRSNRNSFRGNNPNNNQNNLPDGSSFRGGKFANKPQQQRHDNNNEAAAAPPRERTSLRLAPRTKPLEPQKAGGQSNIFGQGRARDEEAYEKRKSVAEAERAAKEATAAAEKEAGGKDDSNNNSTQIEEQQEVPANDTVQPSKKHDDASKEEQPNQHHQHQHHHKNSSDRRSSGRGRGRGEFSARGRGGGGGGGRSEGHENGEHERRSSGRGGRGRGNYDRRSSSGRGEGRGRGRGRREGGDGSKPGGEANSSNKPQNNGGAPEPQPKPPQTPAKVVPPGKVATAGTDKSTTTTSKTVSNKFAALGFDSDSD